MRNGARGDGFLPQWGATLLLRVLDHAVTAPVRPPLSRREHLRRFLSARPGRMGSALALVDLFISLAPGAARRLCRRAMGARRTAWPAGDLKVVGRGSGATVLLVDTRESRAALKLFRRSLGLSLAGVLRIAEEFRGKYETVSSWYNARFELVPRGQVVVIPGPLLGAPVAAMLQRYVDGPMRDLFEEIEPAELIERFRHSPGLRARFLAFAETTLFTYSELGRCIDLVGKRNVALVPEPGGSLSIAVMDLGIFDLADLARRAPRTLRRLEERIEQIRALYGAALEEESAGMERAMLAGRR